MKRLVFILAAAFGISLVCSSFAGSDNGPKFGDTKYLAFEGDQPSWPTGENAEVNKEFSVPIYYGLPAKPYKVLGRIYDDRRSGIGIVGKSIAEGIAPEKDRQRDCANQAKYRGADALLVTDNEKVLKHFQLSEKDIRETAPLFAHKDKIVLAIKFQ